MAAVITERQRHGIVGTAFVVLVVAVFAVGQLGDRDTNATGADGSDVVANSELPPQLFELFDGETASFADFQGKPLVVNFWASWCPACVGELPEFETVHQERGEEVRFLGVANADVRPAAVSLADEVGLTYTLADDPDGVLFREFGLIAMPSTVFVSADGRILEVFAGQLNVQALNDRIDKLVEAS